MSVFSEIWNSWLIPNRKLAYRNFKHIECIECEEYRSDAAPLLSRLIKDYHFHSPTWADLLSKIGFPELERTFKESEKVLPGKYPSPSNEGDQGRESTTRRGNFCEILASEFTSTQMDFNIPVKKFHYNSNPDQSMKGDDLLGFKFPTPFTPNSVVLVGESKFRSNASPSTINSAVKDAYNNVSNNQRPYPISINFVARILELNDEYHRAEIVRSLRRQLQSRQPSMERAYLVFLGTVGQPRDPFSYIESAEKTIANLTAVNVVFATGFVEWVNFLFDRLE